MQRVDALVEAEDGCGTRQLGANSEPRAVRDAH
jgi:hypothetical protein